LSGDFLLAPALRLFKVDMELGTTISSAASAAARGDCARDR
jgi:hypothetical protein